MPLTLDLSPQLLAVCRLTPDTPVDPAWFEISGFVSVTRTEEELSLVVPVEHVPMDARSEVGFRALRVRGPLAFDEVGILADLSGALAKESISLLTLSTFDTDILLVREEDLQRAVKALARAGHRVEVSPTLTEP
jgi:hypothetical protein